MPREIYIEKTLEGLKCSFLDANGKRQDAYFASHLLPETLRNMPIDTMIMPENAAMILKELSPLLPSNCLYLEKVFLHNKRMGTEDYIAQEIVSSHYYDRFKNYEYSKKTDSYAVGQVLKQIWGHDIYESKEHGVVNLTHHFERGDNVLFTIEDNLKSPNQGLRTPLPDVAEKIRQYRSNFLHLYPRVTAVLNVADYEKANKEGKEAFIAALKTVDMVVLVDGTEKNPLSYAHLRRELMGKGVIVDKEVIVSNDPQAIAHRIKSAPANKDIISNIYYLHPEKTKAIHTAVTGMEHITVYANKNDYVNEINENAAKVTDADLETTSQKLKRSLREFLERNSAEINNKNQVISNTGKPVNKSIADRVALLNRNIESIEGYKNDKEHRITYVKLFDDLRKLEKDIVQNKSSFRLKFKPERTLLSVKEIRGDIKYRAADKRATDLNKKVEEINEQEKRPANR
jgi:hypothetical protein